MKGSKRPPDISERWAYTDTRTKKRYAVRITIDMQWLVSQLARRAVANKSRKATDVAQAICVAVEECQ